MPKKFQNTIRAKLCFVLIAYGASAAGIALAQAIPTANESDTDWRYSIMPYA